MANNFMIKGHEDKREINQEEMIDHGKRVHIINQNKEINHKKKKDLRDRLKYPSLYITENPKVYSC